MECAVENHWLSISDLIGDGTSQNISNLVLTEFEKSSIPIENCLLFMADNAAMMQCKAKKNGVIALLKRKNPNIISLFLLLYN